MAYFYNRSVFSQYGFLITDHDSTLKGELLISTMFDRSYLTLANRVLCEDYNQVINITAGDLPLLMDVMQHNAQRVARTSPFRACISERLEFVISCDFKGTWTTQLVELRRVQDLPFHTPSLARLPLTLTVEQFDSMLLHFPKMIELAARPIIEPTESYSISMFRRDDLQHQDEAPRYFLTPEEAGREAGVMLREDHRPIFIVDDQDLFDDSDPGRFEEPNLPALVITDDDIRSAGRHSFDDLLDLSGDDHPFLTPPESDYSPRTSSPLRSPCLLGDIVPALGDLPTHSLNEIAVPRPPPFAVVHHLMVRTFMDKIREFVRLDGPPIDMNNAIDAQDALCSEWRLIMHLLSDTLFQLGYNLNAPTEEQMLALLNDERDSSPLACAVFALRGQPCNMRLSAKQMTLLEAIYVKFSEGLQ